MRKHGIAMKHHRSTGAGSDEGKLHTFVMDCCFPFQGSQQGITVQVDEHACGSEQKCQRIPREGSGGLHEGCDCGCAILKSHGALAIVALQEAAKNSRQSDTILENSPTRESQSNGAAENAVREAERNDTHM